MRNKIIGTMLGLTVLGIIFWEYVLLGIFLVGCIGGLVDNCMVR